MAHVALVIAVEKYAESQITPVTFAEADATDFAAALDAHSFTIQATLLSQKATKTTIESHIRRGLARLTADDTFYLYYAGHGFSKNNNNYVTCHDTDLSDLAATSIRLQWIFEQVGKSKAEKTVLFLDSCESGITAIPQIRGIYTSMSESEIKEFFAESQFRVCFSACKTSESSYSDRNLKHGVWTYHILQALQGNAPAALDDRRYLTATSLQNYVSREVPRTLRSTFSKPVVQTPWMHGSSSRDFLIADLQPILQARLAAKPSDAQVKRILLRVTETLRIKSLSGFKRYHRVPDSVNHATRSFVESISEQEVQQRSEEVFEAIKENLGYKRKDVACGSGKVITPDFEYTASCCQDEETPSDALLTEEITNIKPHILQDDAFNEVFDNQFNELVFDFPRDVQVGDLIDAIEEADLDEIKVNYPSDASWCEIRVQGHQGVIRVTEGELALRTTTKNCPKELVETFYDAQKKLGGTATMKYLPLR